MNHLRVPNGRDLRVGGLDEFVDQRCGGDVADASALFGVVDRNLPGTPQIHRYTNKELSRLVAKYAWLDLLCLDEVGYVKLDNYGPELLFQIITAREERASIACASTANFSVWGQTFTDPRLTAAIVDRLTFRGHIINLGTDSYRLKTTRQAQKG